MYRQGDILLIAVSKIPPRRRVVPDNVLAYGEISGHSHCIKNGIVVQVNSSRNLFVIAQQGTMLVHNEHGPITIAPGKYMVVRQREVDPFTTEPRTWGDVRD